MAERRYDSRSLANRLDDVLPPGQSDMPPMDADPLVDAALRLSAASSPESITPEAKARIRSEVLQAYRQQILPRTRPYPRITAVTKWAIAGIAALVVVVVGLIYFVGDNHKTSSVIEEPLLNPTATPEGVPPTATPLPAMIVVEGVVESISDNTITVFGMQVEVDPADPILADIEVGDHVRVEGELVVTGDTFIIMAVTITLNSGPAPTRQSGVQPLELQPGPPIVVPPGCRITGIGDNNPRLKCSER